MPLHSNFPERFIFTSFHSRTSRFFDGTNRNVKHVHQHRPSRPYGTSATERDSRMHEAVCARRARSTTLFNDTLLIYYVCVISSYIVSYASLLLLDSSNAGFCVKYAWVIVVFVRRFSSAADVVFGSRTYSRSANTIRKIGLIIKLNVCVYLCE